MIKNYMKVGLLAGMLSLYACSSSYTVTEIEGGRVAMTSVYDKDPDAGAVALLKTYQLRKDSIMSPVIGHSAANLVSYRPESPLSNLLADVIKQSTAKLTGEKVDVAVMNMGGIRSALSEGEITYGDVFEITPFENALCLLTMMELPC